MKENLLKWLECMGMCIEARYMSSCHRGILDLISRKHLDVVLKHSVIHKQDLSPKNLSPTLEKFLQTTLNAVHCIKVRLASTVPFARFSEEVCVDNTSLLFHFESREPSLGNFDTCFQTEN
jgi:hypothetical protein